VVVEKEQGGERLPLRRRADGPFFGEVGEIVAYVPWPERVGVLEVVVADVAAYPVAVGALGVEAIVPKAALGAHAL
jgi:hypothetical protein